MKFICKSLLVLLLLTSCAKDVEKKSLIKESELELEMITAYKEGFENINFMGIQLNNTCIMLMIIYTIIFGIEFIHVLFTKVMISNKLLSKNNLIY